MDFEIDVSGSDILGKDYTIVVSSKNDAQMLKAFKFSDKQRQILRARQGQGKYRYKQSKEQKSLFRIRLYCIVIYYLFKALKPRIREQCSLILCRDFYGKENDIIASLNFFLKQELKIGIEGIHFEKLEKNSLADKYAYLIRKDTENLLAKHLVKIKTEEFEKFLK